MSRSFTVSLLLAACSVMVYAAWTAAESKPRPPQLPPERSFDAPAFDPPGPNYRKLQPIAPPQSQFELNADTQFMTPAPERRDPLTEKRQLAMQLTQQYVAMLGAEELDVLIADLEAKTTHKSAELELLDARERLRSLIERFPDTPAARQAQQMLEKLEEPAEAEAAAEAEGESDAPAFEGTIPAGPPATGPELKG